jgi:hypothetical protein
VEDGERATLSRDVELVEGRVVRDDVGGVADGLRRRRPSGAEVFIDVKVALNTLPTVC